MTEVTEEIVFKVDGIDIAFKSREEAEAHVALVQHNDALTSLRNKASNIPLLNIAFADDQNILSTESFQAAASVFADANRLYQAIYGEPMPADWLT